MLNINRKRVRRAYNHRKKVLKSEKSCWTYIERRTRIDTIPAEHRKLAHDFWASPDISRTTPNKKDIVRKRLAPKTYVVDPKQILEKTQTEAYVEFKTKYPEIKMGRRMFESCKPFYIAMQDHKTGYLAAYTWKQGRFSSRVWNLEDNLMINF